VRGILREADQRLELKAMLTHQGHTLETVAETISGLYRIDPEDVLSKGRQSTRVEARSLFCYVATHDLGVSLTELARRLGMTVSAVGYAAMRGKAIAKEKWPHFEDELLRN
jgi:putative transposase